MGELAVFLVLLLEVLDEVSELLLLRSESRWLQVINVLQVVIHLNEGALCVPALIDILLLNDIGLSIQDHLLLSLKEHSSRALLVIRL